MDSTTGPRGGGVFRLNNPSALGCPAWEPKNEPGFDQLLSLRTAAVIKELHAGAYDVLREGRDTRPVHASMFRGLTPAACDYYAGNYRGSRFRCLASYGVEIRSDPRVGTRSTRVAREMAGLSIWLKREIATLDGMATLSSAEDLFLRTVRIAARLFCDFLTIHPYANGNGHTGRFLVWLVLGRFGYWPKKWHLHPRPNLPGYDYSKAIADARSGSPEALEEMIYLSL